MMQMVTATNHETYTYSHQRTRVEAVRYDLSFPSRTVLARLLHTADGATWITRWMAASRV